MAKYPRIEVAATMYKTGLVPVFYHPDIDVCKKVVKACFDGGARVFEFTNRGDFAHEVFSELNRYVLENVPDMIMGIGSVVDSATASLYIQLGTNFIVSPVLVEEMAKICNRRKILWVPGCGTVSEISKAEELGAEIVKIFPGSSVGGPGFVQAIKGPLPWSNIMPTGGVDPSEENLKAWFEAGVSVVGMGSKLITKRILEDGNYTLLKTKVQEVIRIIDMVRK